VRSRLRSHGVTLCLWLALAGLTGCAAVPWPTLTRPTAQSRRTRDGYLDLRGVTHVHTRRSRDSRGTLADVVAASREAGLDWVALSEHRRASGADEAPVPESRSGITLIPGWEVSANGGSMLLMGVDERPPRFASTREAVDWAHRRGGLAVAAHLEKWHDLEATARETTLDGVELVNLHSQLRERSWRFSVATLFLPALWALRTLLYVPPRNLERWESLPNAKGLVGGVDAHAKLRILGRKGTLDRYTDTFRSLTTHVLSAGRDRASILEAIRDGRSYVAFEGLAEVDGFDFTPQTHGVRVDLPRVAELSLVCDGRAAARETGQNVVLTAPPGAERCRIEARLRGRVWLVTAYRALRRGAEARRR